MQKLERKFFVKGTLKAVTGLHIGGSNLSMGIGGADSVVVRDALTNEPYIPGSSIKGKMRSLTEQLLGKTTQSGMNNINDGPYMGDDGDENHVICRLYGRIHKELENIPARIAVRDAYLTDDSRKALYNSEYTDMAYTEVKTEVVLDRVTAASTPRQLERVPAGATFNFELVVNQYEDDKPEDLLDFVQVGLRLMEDDYLGGSGSRGSGQIAIDWDNLELSYKDQEIYEQGEEAKSYEQYSFTS